MFFRFSNRPMNCICNYTPCYCERRCLIACASSVSAACPSSVVYSAVPLPLSLAFPMKADLSACAVELHACILKNRRWSAISCLSLRISRRRNHEGQGLICRYEGEVLPRCMPLIISPKETNFSKLLVQSPRSARHCL